MSGRGYASICEEAGATRLGVAGKQGRAVGRHPIEVNALRRHASVRPWLAVRRMDERQDEDLGEDNECGR